jgi:hypothetical protein
MDPSVIVLQVVGLLVFAAVFFLLRKRSRAMLEALSSGVQPGLSALREGFTRSRTPGESEPVCVVAFHRTLLNAEQVTIGVTNQRVLVVKGAGFHAFPYDYAAEHLPAEEKDKLGRGFFHWVHNVTKSGAGWYCPRVKQFPPFSGQEWIMYPTLEAYPEQTAALREFSRLFYFRWFYN